MSAAVNGTSTENPGLWIVEVHIIIQYFASLKTAGVYMLRRDLFKGIETELAQLPQLLRALFHPFEAVLSQYRVPLKVSSIPHSSPISQLHNFFFPICVF